MVSLSVNQFLGVVVILLGGAVAWPAYPGYHPLCRLALRVNDIRMTGILLY